MIIIYITCSDEEEATNISTHLLEKRLIACTNLIPIKSMYWWKGKVNKENEVVIIAKTKDENFTDVTKEVKKVHSYEVPLIECWKVKDVNKDYLDWLMSEVK